MLARWLMWVTLGLAAAHPDCEHAASLAPLFLCVRPLRLRAAVFLNAVNLRSACTSKQGMFLTQRNLDRLQTANYLFHSALNSSPVASVRVAELTRSA